jgi:hypothetical protein
VDKSGTALRLFRDRDIERCLGGIVDFKPDLHMRKQISGQIIDRARISDSFVYQKPKSGRSGDEGRQGSGVN